LCRRMEPNVCGVGCSSSFDVKQRRYFSELSEILCVEDEEDIDWEDITLSFAMPNASKDYLSKVSFLTQTPIFIIVFSLVKFDRS